MTSLNYKKWKRFALSVGVTFTLVGAASFSASANNASTPPLGDHIARAALPTVEGDIDGDGIPEFDPDGHPYDHDWIVATDFAETLDLDLRDHTSYGGFDVSRSTYEITVRWAEENPDLPTYLQQLVDSGEVSIEASDDLLSLHELKEATAAIIEEYPDVTVSRRSEGLVLYLPDPHPLRPGSSTFDPNSEIPNVPIIGYEEEFPDYIRTSRDSDTGSLTGRRAGASDQHHLWRWH